MFKKPTQSEGAPEWVLTYGDTMSLILVFFVALVAMSEIKGDRFQQAAHSLHKAFGGYEASLGHLPLDLDTPNAVLEQLLELQIPDDLDKRGDSDDEGIHGRNFRVTSVRDGLQIVVGGKISFDSLSAVLKPEAAQLIAQTAERLRGYNTRIVVRGHAGREQLTTDSPFADLRDLSYARAKAVAHKLEEGGVHPLRISLCAAGDTEPLVRQAYTEERRALNRRVEILVTESLVDDYAGSSLADEQKEPADGGH